MHQNDSIVKIKGRQQLSWISPILENWLCVNKEYIEKWNFKDCLYWYNERASVSALAGAIWKAGGFALEEYSTQKGHDDSAAQGRVDLYFSIGKIETIAEAKMKWLYFGERTRLTLQEIFDGVTSMSEEAILHSLSAADYNWGLGLSFVATYWKKNYDAIKKMNALKQFLETYKCSFYTIYENKSKESIISTKDNVCNSVVLIGNIHNK